jgi:hypothetical protein
MVAARKCQTIQLLQMELSQAAQIVSHLRLTHGRIAGTYSCCGHSNCSCCVVPSQRACGFN